MGVTEHISKAFETDLDTTRTRVLQMGGLVEAQIVAAIDAFGSGESALIEQVIENERRVNGYEVAIDGACNHIVVKRQPAASDLRLHQAAHLQHARARGAQVRLELLGNVLGRAHGC